MVPIFIVETRTPSLPCPRSFSLAQNAQMNSHTRWESQIPGCESKQFFSPSLVGSLLSRLRNTKRNLTGFWRCCETKLQTNAEWHGQNITISTEAGETPAFFSRDDNVVRMWCLGSPLWFLVEFLLIKHFVNTSKHIRVKFLLHGIENSYPRTDNLDKDRISRSRETFSTGLPW